VGGVATHHYNDRVPSHAYRGCSSASRGPKRPSSAAIAPMPWAIGQADRGDGSANPPTLDAGRKGTRLFCQIDSQERGMSPPGVPATGIAPRPVVQPGRDARRSSANVRHPATAQVQRCSHSRLTACPAPRPPATVGGRRGRAFGAWCFAGKLRRPASPTRAMALPGPARGLDLYVNGTSSPTSFPTRWGGVPLALEAEAICPAQAPLGEWSGRAERCASRD
jgi:hypothetical protein